MELSSCCLIFYWEWKDFETVWGESLEVAETAGEQVVAVLQKCKEKGMICVEMYAK